MTGRVFSEESKKKMSLAQMGNKKALGLKHSKEHRRKITLARKGKTTSLKGISLSAQHRQNQSTAQKVRVAEGRSNFWKGGIYPKNKAIRDSLEYTMWRESVFKRDNWICVWCGNKGNLEADHILPFAIYPELRFELTNGRTLCRPCHRKTPTWGNGTRKVQMQQK